MADNATVDAMEKGENANATGAADGTPDPMSPLSTSNSGVSADSQTWICGFRI
jgi:hypothetical protein